MNDTAQRKKRLVAGLLALAANFLFFLTARLLSTYDEVSIGQFLYHAQTSGEGSDGGGAMDNILFALCGALLLTTAMQVVYALLSGGVKKLLKKQWYTAYCTGKTCLFFRLHRVALAVVLLGVACTAFLVQTNVAAYVGNHFSEESSFIENHYADPRTVQLTFPKEKRNLICIYLESMENTFGETAAGEPITADYIPELTKLARENVSFSHDEDLGGPYSYEGTT